MTAAPVGSPSIVGADYWWYRARSGLLATVLEGFVPSAGRILDVGSADGPSVGWLRGSSPFVSLDADPRGLRPGGVCGSALELPFGDESFAVVAALDVVEHCEPEARVMGELTRVLQPGGRLLLSVPAYQWAWTSHDDHNGHHRRYTRRRAVQAAEDAGLTVDRVTHIFGATFPFFAVERLGRRVSERGGRNVRELEEGEVPPVPEVPPSIEKVLLGLSRAEQRLLRTRDLPVGSSVVVAATKPR